MKKIILFSIVFLLAIRISAQNTAYFKIANNGSIERIEHVSTGGYITCGTDSVAKAEVIRWDANFNPIWKYKFTDANIAGSPQRIVEANDGSFFYMNTSFEHSGCAYIVKFSSSGSFLWQKDYYLASGSLYSYAFSKGAGTDNGFLFGGGQCALSDYVIKCDQDGNIEWQYQYSYPLSTGVITCWSIIPDGAGYTVSAGYNINSLLTYKLDATGTVTAQSAYTYSTMEISPYRIVKLNATGGYAIVGNYNNTNNNKTEFVAFYNSALSLLSFDELTVTYTEFELTDIAAINNGRSVIVNGIVYDISASTTAIINISNDGNVVWQKRSQSATTLTDRDVEFRCVTVNGNTSVNAGDGYNDGSIIGVIDTLGNGLCNDVVFDLQNIHPSLAVQSQVINVVAANALSAAVSYTYTTTATTTKYRYCGSLSVNDITDLISSVQLFPNPSSNNITIESQQQGIIEICNIEGQLIETLSTTGNNTNIDVSAMPSGVYFIKVTTGKGVAVKKFIKE